MKKTTLAFAALILLLALCSCASTSKDKNAPVETELNVYSIMSKQYADVIFDEFEKDTGIHVNYIRLSSGEALERLLAEKGAPQADVLWGGPSDTYDAAASKGVFAKYIPSGASRIPASFKSYKGYWTGIGLIPLCFVTNTNFLKENNLSAPQSWNDYLDPIYNGQLQIANPKTSGTGTERIYSLCMALGSEDAVFDYEKNLKKNVQLYTKSGPDGLMPVATGEAAGGVFYLVDALDIQQKGYPLTVTYPKEGVTYGVEGAAIIANCEHPNAAKTLMDWASSKQLGNTMMREGINYVPTRADIVVTNPALDLSKMPLKYCDSTWKGENRARFVERFENDVLSEN